MRDDVPDSEGPAPLPGLDRIAPYVPGDSHLEGRSDIIKLSSNESALGTSEKARAAYLACVDKLHLYPDGGSTPLRNALAALHGIEAERIVCGTGSDEFLQVFGRAYAAPGDEILFTKHGFLVYSLVAKQVRATGVAAPEANYTADVDALLAAVTTRTKVVYLANPNNPTGTLLPASEIRRLHAGLPKSVLLVLDGAYAEFVEDDDYDAGLALARTEPNVVMVRTFSKIYGLAGLRVGWMYGPAPVVDVVNRLRSPFNVPLPAIAAAAAAAEDQDFVRASIAHNSAERARLEAVAERLGILAVHGACNFVVLKFPQTPGKTVKEADAFLRERGIILRGLAVYQMPDCLRATIGRVEENDRVIHALEEFMGAA